MEPGQKENADAMAELIISCAEKNIDVVAYDTRDNFGNLKAVYHHCIKALNESKAVKVAEKVGSTDEYFDTLRRDISPRSWVMGTKNRDKRAAWAIQEIEWLLTKKPDYQKKFAAIENYVETGLKIINKSNAPGAISSDGLSAGLLHSMTQQKGNRLVIAGLSHISGMGDVFFDADEDPETQRVQGLFQHHLFSANEEKPPQKHKVTSAVIAGVGLAEDLKINLSILGIFANQVAKTKIVQIDPEAGTVEKSSFNIHPKAKVKELEEFAPMYHRNKMMQAIHKKEFANPLLRREIKQAADEVQTAMCGKQIGNEI